MNMVTVFIVATAALLLISGILFGLLRGSRKAFLRLMVTLAVAIICIFMTPAITKAVVHMNFVEDLAFGGESYEEFAINFVDEQLKDGSFLSEFFDYAQADYAELIQQLPFLVANLIVFMALSFLLWLVGIVVYWILVAIFARTPKRKREDAEKKPNKRRWLGALLGAVSGLVLFVMTMTPLCGLISVAANAQDIKVDGKYIMQDSYFGFKTDFKEYVNSPLSKVFSVFGLTDMFFDNLTTIEFDGRKIVLANELNTLIDLVEEFDGLNGKEITLTSLFEDPAKLKRMVSTLLSSELVSSLCNKFLDYLAENPQAFLSEKDAVYADLIAGVAKELRKDFSGEINDIIDFASTAVSNLKSADGKIELSDLLTDTAALKNIVGAMHDSACIINIVKLGMNFIADNLETIAGGNEMIKENNEAFSKLFRTLADSSKEEMIEAIENFGVISSFGFFNGSVDLTSLSASDADKLVDAMFGSAPMREVIVILAPALIKPLLTGLDFEASPTTPVITDWEKEKNAFKTILSNIGLLSELMSTGGTENSVARTSFATVVSNDNSGKGIKDIFSESNARAFGELFNAFRDSQILKPLYNGLIKWDDSKKEYYVVAKFNELINQNGENLMSISKVFRQKGATLQSPQTPNKNIDWDLFNWNTLFGGIVDGINLFTSLELLQNDIIGEESNVDDICALIGSLGDEDKSETIQTIIDSILPSDSGITIPDLTTVTDFEKEAEIFRNVVDLKDKEDLTQNDVNTIISMLSGSELILPVLESFGGDVTITDEAKSMVENALKTQSIDPILKARLEALFGIGK